MTGDYWTWELPNLPKIPALPRIVWDDEPVREPAVTRASAIAALDAQAAMFMAEKASREDYILELRAKLKRASRHHESLASDVYRERGNANIWRRRADEARAFHEFDLVRLSKDVEQGKASLAKLRGVEEQLRGVEEQLAVATANAESLERDLPAAVEAATAKLQAELAETRRYVCDLITDRDAAKKERDEAVAAAEWRSLQLANIPTPDEESHAATRRAIADADACRDVLAVAEKANDTLRGLLGAEQVKLSQLHQENEKLRALSSEACAEREQLREKLVKSEDGRVYAIRVANANAATATAAEKALRRIDQILSDYASGSYRARDVVKELCRLRGIK